jgi:superfamily II DNA or RNA helicase
VEQAHALADVIAGYVRPDKVKALDGTTAQADRRDMIAQFRDGTVQFLINCAVLTEGFDAPETACIAVARPTKSRSLYAQMIGRGTRIADGKDNCLILDFVGNAGRHKLVTPLDVLAGGPIPEDVRRDALGYIDEGHTTEEALEAAEQRAQERERLAAEQRRRQAKIQARVGYRARTVDPFEVLGVEASANGPRATEKQLAFLKRNGLDLSGTPSKRQASKLIDRLIGRRQRGLCTWKQARLLARHGLPPDVSFEDASRAISAIGDNGWRVPEWLRVELTEAA